MTTQHTPTPWEFDHVTVSDEYGNICKAFTIHGHNLHIASLSGLLHPEKSAEVLAVEYANAAHIVHCVNTHSDTVAALAIAAAWIDHQQQYNQERYGAPDEEDRNVLDIVRAALAAAKTK